MIRARSRGIALIRFFPVPLFLLLTASPAADTVILKNGKRYENVSARPLPGGSLEVILANGRRLRFKRERVKSLFIGPTRAARRKTASRGARKTVKRPRRRVRVRRRARSRTRVQRKAEPAASRKPNKQSVVGRAVAPVNKSIGKPVKSRTGSKISRWSFALPGYRPETREHNWLLSGYVLMGALLAGQGSSALAAARSDFNSADNFAVLSLLGNVSLGGDQTPILLIFRDLRLAAADRGTAATNRMNLGALLIVGAYLYNAWELTRRPGNSRGTPIREAAPRGTAVEIDADHLEGGRLARSTELRVKWFARF